jgi:DNA-binding PucR family transcriptional regulator
VEIEWEPARPAKAQQVWQRVLRPIAAELSAHAAVLADQSTAVFQAELPRLFPDTESVMQYRRSTVASIQLLARLIEQGADPRQSPLPAATVEATRSGVERQVPLAAVLRSYRLGHEMVWQWLFGQVTATCADAAEQATATSLASGWLFAYIDTAVAQAERRYEAERDAWMRTAAAARADAIDAVLAGREHSQHRATTRLRFELGRHHLGMIAWGTDAAPDSRAGAVVADTVNEMARSVGAEATLTHLLGPQTQAAWLSRAAPFTEADLESSRSTLPAGVRVALGEPAPGLDGFRRTHIEAGHARRVATLTEPQTSALTRYRDVAVAALGTVDAEQARTFVTRALGPLAADDEATFRVAMTLAAYLDENRSPSRTAERLTVHPNTVTYRVNQARQILGRGIEHDTLDLRVALALLPTLRGL